jgi:hypothetical protein
MYYNKNSMDPKGYTDYPFAKELDIEVVVQLGFMPGYNPEPNLFPK